MKPKYPKGSVWRKWDLHVHTPASALNNNFGNNWEEYVKLLLKAAIQKEVTAIGVTDYFCIEGYKRIKDYISDDFKIKTLFASEGTDYLEGIKNILILPNIEFRLNKIINGKRLNLHIIFSNEVSIQDIEENFLYDLDFVYEGNPQSTDEKWKLKLNNLEALGRKLKNEHAPFKSKTDLEIGMMNAVVNDEEIAIILSDQPSRFKDKYLLILAEEGLPLMDWDGQDHQTRKVLLQKSDCIFSANPKTIEWCLGKKHSTIEEFICEFKGLKPCLWGSDAHSYDKLFEPDLKRYTWIKADPTFEGLKQIIYEPEDRVYIGEEPPRKLERDKIIKSITISNSNSWFENDKPIPLNEGLVSIIGGKGSGKTAILDLIACATNSYKYYENDETKSKSFLKKAFRELKGTKIKVEWDEGIPDEKEVGNKLEDFIEEGKVRYLPQDFIEELCTELGKENLEKQIENVIFQNIPKEYKANYSDFSSYKNAQIKVINDKKKRVDDQIKEINSKIFEITEVMVVKDKKKNEIIEVEKEISKLDEEMKKISSSIKDAEDQQIIIKDLSDINDKKTNIEREISGLNAKLLKIDDIKNKISVFAEYAEEFVEEVKGDLKAIQFPPEVIGSIKVKLEPDNIASLLDNKKQDIAKEIETKKKELDAYIAKIQDLNKNLKLEKTKQDRIKEINTSLNQQKEKISSLKEDFENIIESEKSLQGLFKKRESLFINFFEILFEEKEKLKTIYSPLENILNQSTEENERLFDFSVQFNFDVKEIAEKGDKFIDHTKEGRFRRKTEQAVIDEIEQLKFSLNLEDKVMSNSDKDTVKKFLLNVENLFLKDENGREFKIFTQLKKGTEKDFDDWLYSTNYYNVVYSIRFNKTGINNLSPGLKGVALLILYLDLDKEDARPILIDQPEENLDNRSVYKTLKRYFMEAKRNRQVIIVTHNPNLVVNTDSEQVIVADFDRGLTKQQSRIYYISGSLENSFKNGANIDLEKQGIREHVCEILEGGKEAFEKREKKYGFKS